MLVVNVFLYYALPGENPVLAMHFSEHLDFFFFFSINIFSSEPMTDLGFSAKYFLDEGGISQ